MCVFGTQNKPTRVFSFSLSARSGPDFLSCVDTPGVPLTGIPELSPEAGCRCSFYPWSQDTYVPLLKRVVGLSNLFMRLGSTLGAGSTVELKSHHSGTCLVGQYDTGQRTGCFLTLY